MDEPEGRLCVLSDEYSLSTFWDGCVLYVNDRAQRSDGTIGPMFFVYQANQQQEERLSHYAEAYGAEIVFQYAR